MSDYQLTITRPGQPPAVRTVAGNTPLDLAPAVHRHARGLLGGQIAIRLDGLEGTVHRGAAHIANLALTPVETRPQPGSNTEWTLADIDRMAASAVVADRSLALDARARYETAWSAIALAIAEARDNEPPTWQDLVRTGWQAIYADVRQVRHLYGIPPEDTSRGVASRQRFAAYWRPTAADPAEEALIDGIAVHQILNTLPDTYRDAVIALATHGTVQAAANALGISYGAMNARMTTAKRLFRRDWFAPDPAPKQRGTDRRVGSYTATLADQCKAGHDWTPENTRWDRGRGSGHARVRRCRACERDRSRARRQAVA